MAKTKTTYTDIDVKGFVNSYVENEQKRNDSFRLIEHMQEWSGFEPKMWGSTIIGFGNYHYKYESGHEGDAPIIGFSPRKAAFSLYVYSPTERSEKLLIDLGKFKMSKACIYVKKISDINISILHEICIESIKYINEHYEWVHNIFSIYYFFLPQSAQRIRRETQRERKNVMHPYECACRIK